MYFPNLDPYSVILTLTLMLLTQYNGNQEEYQNATKKSIIQEISESLSVESKESPQKEHSQLPSSSRRD